MVEQHRFGNLLPHLVLWIGIAIVAFPVYLAFVASTHEPTIISNGQMPLTPGAHFLENYYRTIFVGTSGTTREPVGTMLFNSLVMALGDLARQDRDLDPVGLRDRLFQVSVPHGGVLG